MGDQTHMTEGPTVLMFMVAAVLIGASAVLWARRAEPRNWPSIHVLSTVLVVHGVWGIVWLYYGLKFWNGFLAPTYMTLKMLVKLLPVLLKAL
jgi:hypothetical protein